MRILLAIPLVTCVFLGCASAPDATSDRSLPGADASSSERVGGEKKAPTESSQPNSERKNSLKWTTASEVENFGFDIYKSTSEDGPFTRVTDEPLPGAGTVDEPQSYEWYDFDIEPGVDYFYYIESISMGGVRERFSPVIKAPAKD